MRKLVLIIGLLAGTGLSAAFAGDVWEWAPGHYSYTDDRGHPYEGWQWAPGHTTWTIDNGHGFEVWEWAPGHWSVESYF